jgi:glucosamine-6-phosphate deaminase
MLVVLKQDAREVGQEAARIVSAAVRTKPSIVLGLATGTTSLGMYEELVSLHKNAGLDFSKATSFNLDEYVGLAPDNPQSFNYFMHSNFFSHINFSRDSIHIPSGALRANYSEYCESYENEIKKAGGIDLQILGIGRNGHIGFNEPNSSLASRTRLKELTQETIEDNRRFFPKGEEIPECAITMGIGTILDARRIVILATGQSKAAAVAKAIEGPISSSVSASALQLHPDVTFIIDEDAAYALTQRDYYRRVLELTKKYTPEKLA